MTALPPISNRRVLGVPATKYEANKMCAHPECSEAVPDRGHHIFPRSTILNDSYFVRIEGDEMVTIPHVTGLCREHHDAVERHFAWIKLEDDDFVWYDRVTNDKGWVDDWVRNGPLDPQPGGRVKSKKPKKRFKGEERRKRARISIAVPQDAQEDGGAVWDELMGDGKDDRPYGLVRERLDELGVDGNRPPYYVLIDSLSDWLNS